MKHRSFLLVCCLIGFAHVHYGQVIGYPQSNPADSASGVTASAPQPSNISPVPSEGLLSRWLDIDTFSASMRYRNTANSGGFHPFHFGQHRELLDGNFKLDRAGNYVIHFHASSGRYFNWAYADCLEGQFTDGVPHAGPFRPAYVSRLIGQALKADPNSPYPKGIESRGAYIYFRQLYFSATPIKQVTFEYGGLGIEHGENTEITSFDDDGYIAGARVRVHDPEHLFFTEINATWADLAGALTPSFFDRGRDLREVNYQQYMARKNLGRFAATVDFTVLQKTRTMREAFKVKVPEVHFMDSARLELYQRANAVSYYGIGYPSGTGFAITGTKKLFNKRFDIDGGYAHIDHFYGVYTGDPFLVAVGFAWNGDSFMTGSKAFTRGSLKVAPGLSLFAFFAHEVAPFQSFITNHATANGGITLDMDDLMHRAHIL